MTRKIIDMTKDPRGGQFEYFRSMSDPWAGITVPVDITDLLDSLHGRPFFLSYLYAVMRAANAVPELRRRLLPDGQVVEYGRTIDIFNHPKSEVARELLQKDEGNATEPKSLKTTDRIKNGTRIRIVYTENSAFEPVIANMILTFKEPVNILKAATKNVGGVAKGEMILELPKGSTNVAAMEQYLKERGLELEELSNNVDGGEEHVDRAN